ncbi:MAG: response regulator transcription factor [Cellulosilyticaceae bacterium]
MNKILIIEDDKRICEELKFLLENNDYRVAVIDSFEDVLEQIRVYEPQLILLDINLPVKSGYELCSEIRGLWDIPIIFVTSRNTDMDELNSIIRGGDAFITKPYNIAILLAKIAALLKRYQKVSERSELEHQGVVLGIENNKLSFGGEEVILTKNEFQIMYYLFRNKGCICSRADLIEYLWDQQVYVEDNTLSVNVTRIREKLHLLGVEDFIVTKHRQGYMI